MVQEEPEGDPDEHLWDEPEEQPIEQCTTRYVLDLLAMDLELSGNGFLILSEQSDEVNAKRHYARSGEFSLNSDDYIVNENGEFLHVYSVNEDGFSTSVDINKAKAFSIPRQLLSPLMTSDVFLSANLDARTLGHDPSLFDPRDEGTFHRLVITKIYDSLGSEHVLVLYYVKDRTAYAGVNQWYVFASIGADAYTGAPIPLDLNNVFAGVDAGAFGGGGLVTASPVGAAGDGNFIGIPLLFDSSGNLTHINGYDPTLAGNVPPFVQSEMLGALGSGALINSADASQQIMFNFAKSTQFASELKLYKTEQDGRAVGYINELEIDDSGLIKGHYTNGVSKPLARLALAYFSDNEALDSLADSVWFETLDSGRPLASLLNEKNSAESSRWYADLSIDDGKYFVLTNSAMAADYVYAKNITVTLDKSGYLISNEGEALQVYTSDKQTEESSSNALQVPKIVGNVIKTSQVDISVNLDSRRSGSDPTLFDPNNDDTFDAQSTMTIYDSLGGSHNLTTYYVKDITANVGVNQWTVFASIDVDSYTKAPMPLDLSGVAVGGDVVTSQLTAAPISSAGDGDFVGIPLTFDSSQRLSHVNGYDPLLGGNSPPFVQSQALGITGAGVLTNGADVYQTLTVNFTDMTQFSAAFDVFKQQDNAVAVGRLSNLSIDPQGRISAFYSNGIVEHLGYLELASFDDSKALFEVLPSRWQETVESGTVKFSSAELQNESKINSKMPYFDSHLQQIQHCD